MDRSSRRETTRPRRLFTGVALVMAATAVLIATARASSTTPGRAGERSFPNPSGVLATVGTNGTEAENPFFQELGTNGRSCATCHRPAQAWTITPAELHVANAAHERFQRPRVDRHRGRQAASRLVRERPASRRALFRRLDRRDSVER